MRTIPDHVHAVHRANRLTGGLLGLLILALSTPVLAGMFPVDSGEKPQLDSDEGLLLVSLDSTIPLETVYMRQDGAILGSGVLKRTQAGREFQLFRVPSGSYGWHSIRTRSRRLYELEDNPEFHFEVRPGKISYGGDLVFRPEGAWHAQIHTANRGLAALDWLETEHPELADTHEFVFAGHYDDPFPEFYRGSRLRLGVPEGKVFPLQVPPEPGKLPLPASVMWQPERVQLVSLNPDGDLLAIHLKEQGEERWIVDLINLTAGESYRVAESDVPFESFSWSGSRNLLMTVRDVDGTNKIKVVQIGEDSAGKLALKSLEVPRSGQILDTLPNDPAHILFASYEQSGRLLVHKLDISNPKNLARFNADVREKINSGVGDDVWWLADKEGNLRIAVAFRDNRRVLLRKEGDKYVEFFRSGSETDFSLSILSPDGKMAIGISDKDRDQRDLVEFDLDASKISRTLFSKPGVDVVSPILDNRQQPTGVRYYEDGRLVSEYFEPTDQALASRIQRTFPDRNVVAVDQSANASQVILLVDGSGEPAKIYHLDTLRNRASLIEDTMPWLKPFRLAPSTLIKSKSKDGLPIEAFLTLPEGDGKKPVIVMAHGGPVGVRDHLRFDRDVQFLASLGYAVLQVNFRGSEGYGKAFREAAYRNYGTLIEDDIDAALKQAINEYPLDEKRMCVLGFSYGGFSALVSAARWPDRFRCVVSVSGISDLILFFTASDSGRSKQGREALEKIIGDPKTQQEVLIRSSPLYSFSSIKTPVMLVHGLEDLRVDYEHMRRMRRMLDLNGNTPVGLIFPEAGHSIRGTEELDIMWTRIAGFLQTYLDTAHPVAGQDAVH